MTTVVIYEDWYKCTYNKYPVISKKNFQINLFLVSILKATEEKNPEPDPESSSTDPDPYQKVTYPDISLIQGFLNLVP